MLRIAREADLPEMLEIYTPYIVNATASFEYVPPSPEEFHRRFTQFTKQFPWLVWEEDGRLLGYAYASAPFSRAAYQWCAEPTIYLREEAHGTGIAGKLYAALEEILFAQGYQVLYSLVCGENIPSLRFHEKSGYRIRAVFPAQGFKFGRWLDMIWLEKRPEMAKIPSSPPCKWSEIVHSSESLTNILDKLSICESEKV